MFTMRLLTIAAAVVCALYTTAAPLATSAQQPHAELPRLERELDAARREAASSASRPRLSR